MTLICFCRLLSPCSIQCQTLRALLHINLPEAKSGVDCAFPEPASAESEMIFSSVTFLPLFH